MLKTGRLTAFHDQPLRHRDRPSWNDLAQPGVAVPANLQESSERQPHGRHGTARRHETELPALPRRELPRRAGLREPLQLEGDDRTAGTTPDVIRLRTR